MSKLNKNVFLYSFSFIVSYILMINIFHFFGFSTPFNKYIFITATVGLTLLTVASSKVCDKIIVVPSAILSILLSVSLVVGKKFVLGETKFQEFHAIDILYILVLSLGVFMIICNIIDFIHNHLVQLNYKNINISLFIITFAILVICFIPYLFVYYPGNISLDSSLIIKQSLGIHELNNYQVLMFVLLVKLLINLGLNFGDINFAIFLFSLFQLIIFSLVISYFVYFMAKRGIPNSLITIVVLYFALNPVVASYSITMWKDILFSAWILLFILLLYNIVEKDEDYIIKPKIILTIAGCCFLVSFGRNNGIYIVFATLITLVIYFRKYYKILVPSFIAVLATIILIQGPVYSYFNIPEGNFAEAVGIPIQQIGYTAKNGGEISEKDIEFIENIIPFETLKEAYYPISPDFIKFHADFNNDFLNNNKLEFIKVWSHILPKNLSNYIKAYLMQTVGYWNIGTSNWVVFNRVIENNLGIYGQDYLGTIVHYNIKGIFDYIIKKVLTLPIIDCIYNIALMVWITFLYCAMMIVNNRKKYIIPIVPLLGIWGTMMIAAPTFCEFRYMFSFHLALPFLLITMFFKNEKTEICSTRKQ